MFLLNGLPNHEFIGHQEFDAGISPFASILPVSSTSSFVQVCSYLGNSQYAFEVVKNVNFVLGPSSREILFYLRADNDDSDIDFVEE